MVDLCQVVEWSGFKMPFQNQTTLSSLQIDQTSLDGFINKNGNKKNISSSQVIE
jgi:hypothetical protein